jgi:hypothetical protein
VVGGEAEVLDVHLHGRPVLLRRGGSGNTAAGWRPARTGWRRSSAAGATRALPPVESARRRGYCRGGRRRWTSVRGIRASAPAIAGSVRQDSSARSASAKLPFPGAGRPPRTATSVKSHSAAHHAASTTGTPRGQSPSQCAWTAARVRHTDRAPGRLGASGWRGRRRAVPAMSGPMANACGAAATTATARMGGDLDRPGRLEHHRAFAAADGKLHALHRVGHVPAGERGADRIRTGGAKRRSRDGQPGTRHDLCEVCSAAPPTRDRAADARARTRARRGGDADDERQHHTDAGAGARRGRCRARCGRAR